MTIHKTRLDVATIMALLAFAAFVFAPFIS